MCVLCRLFSGEGRQLQETVAVTVNASGNDSSIIDFSVGCFLSSQHLKKHNRFRSNRSKFLLYCPNGIGMRMSTIGIIIWLFHHFRFLCLAGNDDAEADGVIVHVIFPDGSSGKLVLKKDGTVQDVYNKVKEKISVDGGVIHIALASCKSLFLTKWITWHFMCDNFKLAQVLVQFWSPKQKVPQNVNFYFFNIWSTQVVPERTSAINMIWIANLPTHSTQRVSVCVSRSKTREIDIIKNGLTFQCSASLHEILWFQSVHWLEEPKFKVCES